MSIIKAYRLWEKKKLKSDFERIKINTSGSFYMKSGDLFENKEEVKKYVQALNTSLKERNNLEKQKS